MEQKTLEKPDLPHVSILRKIRDDHRRILERAQKNLDEQSHVALVFIAAHISTLREEGDWGHPSPGTPMYILGGPRTSNVYVDAYEIVLQENSSFTNPRTTTFFVSIMPDGPVMIHVMTADVFPHTALEIPTWDVTAYIQALANKIDSQILCDHVQFNPQPEHPKVE